VQKTIIPNYNSAPGDYLLVQEHEFQRLFSLYLKPQELSPLGREAAVFNYMTFSKAPFYNTTNLPFAFEMLNHSQ
jgi:hypothetical protein